MSDTVKLIIEIPKDYYEALAKAEEIISLQRSGKTLMSVIYSAVANATPLDDVMAEIEASKWTDRDIRFERNALASGLERAIEIINDSIGRAENEVENETDN